MVHSQMVIVVRNHKAANERNVMAITTRIHMVVIAENHTATFSRTGMTIGVRKQMAETTQNVIAISARIHMAVIAINHIWHPYPEQKVSWCKKSHGCCSKRSPW